MVSPRLSVPVPASRKEIEQGHEGLHQVSIRTLSAVVGLQGVWAGKSWESRITYGISSNNRIVSRKGG
jgi:hypothetical protein